MSKSSLSSVVSNLVRAQMGSAVSNTVTDEDLDKHIAELILKEAKQKAEQYGKEGFKAYLPQKGWSDSNAPKPNKRFLSSIIKSTDDHNKTILRAQAQAAEEVRQERREMERRERRLRAEEAVEAEKMRLKRLMGGSLISGKRRKEREESWSRSRSEKKRKRSWERRDDYWDDEESGSDHLRQRRENMEDRDRGRDKDKSREKHRDRDDGEDDRRWSSRRKDEDDRERRHRHRHRHHHRSRSTERRSRRESRRSSRSASPRRRSRSYVEHADPDSRRERKRDRSTSVFPDDTRKKQRRDRSKSAQRDKSDEESSGYRQHNNSERGRTRSRERSRPRSQAQDEDEPMENARSREDDLPSTLRSKFQANVGPSSKLHSPAPRSRSITPGPPPPATIGEDSHTLPSSRHMSPQPPSSSPPPPPPASPPPGPPPSNTRFRPRSPSPPSTARSKSHRFHKQHKSSTSHKKHHRPRSPSASPPPLPSHTLPSKMDKYFEPDYDPRLDVAPLSVPPVPSTGLIPDADYEGWDAMLELIRLRREDKLDKKRGGSVGLGMTSSKKDKDRVGEKWESGNADILNIEYKKRGSVREWDLGKEGF
ncbi:hypothetical protein ABKN59_003171 [Abortiporus biennis]